MTPVATGLCPPVDNATIQIVSNKLTAVTATAGAPGISRPDGTSISVTGGVLSTIGANIGAHGCRLWNSAAITQANTTALSFDTNSGTGLFDTDAYHAAANPTRITIPATQAGYYQIHGYMLWPTQTSGTYRTLYIQLNGLINYIVGQNSLPYVSTNSNSSGNWQMVSAIYHFAAGDYIELFAVSDQTGQSIGSYGSSTNHYAPIFSCFRIG
jgi:hypothetical protein